MKTLIIVIASVFVLSGCFTAFKRDTQVVEVPIATKCNPTIKVTEIVEYPFDKAKKDMPLYDKSQLALSELKLLRGQNKELKAALSECTK